MIRSYDKIQSAYADVLDEDAEISVIKCNVGYFKAFMNVVQCNKDVADVRR